jgi:hypothetical protein
LLKANKPNAAAAAPPPSTSFFASPVPFTFTFFSDIGYANFESKDASRPFFTSPLLGCTYSGSDSDYDSADYLSCSIYAKTNLLISSSSEILLF